MELLSSHFSRRASGEIDARNDLEAVRTFGHGEFAHIVTPFAAAAACSQHSMFFDWGPFTVFGQKTDSGTGAALDGDVAFGAEFQHESAPGGGGDEFVVGEEEFILFPLRGDPDGADKKAMVDKTVGT